MTRAKSEHPQANLLRLGRRRFLAAASAASVGGIVWGSATAWARPVGLSGDGAEFGPTEALNRLLEGNRRFIAAEALRPNQDEARRIAVAQRQTPFAAVLSCSDSRVVPEIVFDQGLGDLFVVRLAGNIADTAALGSLEYAVEDLGVSLILVLGHERCGAVAAAVDYVLHGAQFPGNIQHLIGFIRPAVERARPLPGDLVDNAIRVNVALTVGYLRTANPGFVAAIGNGDLDIVGARYDLTSGAVEILPWLLPATGQS